MVPFTEQALIALAKTVIGAFRGRFPAGVSHEDALQDAVLGILEHAPKYPDQSRVSRDAWLVIRVRGVLRDRYGKLWREQYAAEGVAGSHVGNETGQSPDCRAYFVPIQSPEDVEATDAHMDLMAAIDRLPPREAQVMRLAALGLNQPEIAKKLGVGQPYVSQIMTRGKAALREALGEAYQ